MLSSWEQATLADIEARLRREDLELAQVLERFDKPREQPVVVHATTGTEPTDVVADDPVADALWPYVLVWLVVCIVLPGFAVGVAILTNLLI